ncbi:MAG: hypothetical protein H6741_30220 [Alphaproteobacteria bacterium]|nr:hypothetical protein [Alphaproteobacteria bacterium]
MTPAFVLLLACSAPPPLGSGHYSIADDGQTVHHEVGQVVEVALPAALGRPQTQGELLFYLGPAVPAAGDGLERHRYRVMGEGVARVRAGEFSLVVEGRE